MLTRQARSSRVAEKGYKTFTVGTSHWVHRSSHFGIDLSLDLLLKDDENGGGRVADLELGDEWMGE